jgi:hypothetical protein
MEDKVRENRLRAMAARQGLVLSKSRQRDLLGLLYGRYSLTYAETNLPVQIGEGLTGGYPFANLDEVELVLVADVRLLTRNKKRGKP